MSLDIQNIEEAVAYRDGLTYRGMGEWVNATGDWFDAHDIEIIDSWLAAAYYDGLVASQTIWLNIPSAEDQ